MRRWRKLDSLRAFWYKITFRLRLALAVLFKLQKISILHNYLIKGREVIAPKPESRHGYVTYCYFEPK